MNTIFDEGLDQTRANYEPLSPLSFLCRTAAIYPEYVAVVYGQRSLSYEVFLDRCRAFAGFLDQRGLGHGDVVSVMLPNIPEMLELSHAAITGGRVLHAVNIRLDPAAIRFQLQHAESRIIVFDREYASVIAAALSEMTDPPLAIEVFDPSTSFAPVHEALPYEQALEQGRSSAHLRGPDDEWAAIALSYTSGTTGNPKGVVTHHRGAYLNATANSVAWSMRHHPTYLWVLPLFHCNGWCFPWTVTLLAGTHVCLRKVDAREIIRLSNACAVTNFCAAPVVLSLLATCQSDGLAFEKPVQILTAGAAPAPQVIADVERLNANVTQVYGLTETYASTVISAWKGQWNEFQSGERYRLKGRAGVQFPACAGLDVVDAANQSVPRDGATVGEVVVRGNTVMRGYLKNPVATAEAFEGGWFHTGDLGVLHADGYMAISDRKKDMINSGGEKMSSLEIEEVLLTHPSVFEAAVVSAPNPMWGEVPWAFVGLKPGHVVDPQALLDHCARHLARFKIPKQFVFGPIERTATGKVQKFRLRELAAEAVQQDVPVQRLSESPVT